jgi:hypothetical protein
MASLPDRGIRGSLEDAQDAQDGSGACRPAQSADGGADARVTVRKYLEQAVPSRKPATPRSGMQSGSSA